MFKSPDGLFSASNNAILTSENVTIPLSLHTSGRSAFAAFNSLHRAFHDVKSFLPSLATVLPNLQLPPFDANSSAKNSRVQLEISGKDYNFSLKFVLSYPISKTLDYWQRIQLVANGYDKLAELSTIFNDRKDTELYLGDAIFGPQKDDSEKSRASTP